MNLNESKRSRVLAVVPSTRGFGFAVLEGRDKLVDWGVKTVKQDKNAGCVAKLEKLIDESRPAFLALEDYSKKAARRSSRIKAFGEQMAAAASSMGVKIKRYGRKRVGSILFGDERTTKHARAQMLAGRFAEELESRLPGERRPWMSEAYQMGIFDAVALALACQKIRRKASKVDSEEVASR